MSQPQHEAAYLIEKYGFTEAIARTEKALAGLSGPGRDETAEWHTRAILAYLEGYKAAKKPDCLAAVKSFLEEEPHVVPRGYPEAVGAQALEVLPILHNEGVAILQFCGWSINLLANGQWVIEGTEGG